MTQTTEPNSAAPLEVATRARLRWLDRSVIAIAVPVLLSLALSLFPFVQGHVPQADVQDEFAHLLAADTFVHGRLTNPPPTLWPFFEAVHILVQPTYMSKFLPGQGLLLAFGQLLGWPILGCYLAAAAACGAIAWCILSCLPGRWAMIGGCLAACHPLLIWWSQTYWGGELATLGGALLMGTALRLSTFSEYRQHWAWLAGIGCGLLLLTRPLEGGITGVLLAGTLMYLAWKRRAIRHVLRPVPIMVAVSAVTLGWMAFYNYRVTGSPLQLPYTLAAKQYMTAPLMWWQPVSRPPQYRNGLLAHFYRDYEWPEYAAQSTFSGFVSEAAKKWIKLWGWFVRDWVLAVPLIGSLFLLPRERAARLSLLLIAGLPAVQMCCTPWLRNHYMGPALGGFFCLIVFGLAGIAQFRWRGLRIGQMAVTILLLAFLLPTGASEAKLLNPPDHALGIVRQRKIEELNAMSPRKKLVFIRHLPMPDESLSDIVYNSADIDSQQIIFARDLGDAVNQKLIDYYKDRETYVLTFETILIARYSPTTRPSP